MNNPTDITLAADHLQLSPRTLERLERLQQFARQNQGRFSQLSRREKEILSLICRDFKNEDIARLLFISVHTVRTHRNNIWRTLRISSVVEAMRWAQAFDLV
ncbi:response regulator transcription factor [Neolewinella agarilytica]|uniref:response regulator transcription factor n=1 Tax=Neolewinella agarilytica TaxID=478744 RepID=UPI002352F4EA|nr:LuxR C-terminal-related transcriptional regulator [Neolewinella agarilytica]